LECVSALILFLFFALCKGLEINQSEKRNESGEGF
jgi:hypothetical protein